MIRKDFNRGWTYRREDAQEAVPVTLPHDAMLRDPRDPESPGGRASAYFPGGVYIYEKDFFVSEEMRDRTLSLEFGGIYRNSEIYVNDILVGGRPYGFVPFSVCLDEALKYGETNHIRVKADNSALPNCRWYSGGGIYRPVSLLVGAKEHIVWEGVRITTLGLDPATIRVQTQTTVPEDTDIRILIEVRDMDGICVASGEGADMVLEIPEGRPWSAEDPVLYRCTISMLRENELLDQTVETFGIRELSWSKDGFFVNGVSTLLRGACIHHDNGILGACSYREAEERRVRILKNNGFNAIRMAHNPASRVLLEACDAIGMYVLDETFDMWYEHKNHFDYASDFPEWYLTDTEAMVSQDYNHPSVIMYSIGNEVSEPVSDQGMETARKLIDKIHAMDETRPVTGCMNLMILALAEKGWGILKGEEEVQRAPKAVGKMLFNGIKSYIGAGINHFSDSRKVDTLTTPILDALDIAGYNYASGRYKLEEKKHPGRVILGTETFPGDIGKNWEMVRKYPYLIGDFMWTGWDYLGEAGIGSWNYEDIPMTAAPYPWILSETGAIDIIGYAGAEAHYAAAIWNQSEHPYIGVRPVNHAGEKLSASIWRGTNAFASWSWKGCEGKPAEVEVYAASDQARSVKLYLNGTLLGKKDFVRKKAIFHVEYQPGTLAAVTYDGDGNKLGGRMLMSAMGQIHLAVKPEKKRIAAGEIVYVHVCIQGTNGVVESNLDQKVRVTVEHGELLGYGSARPCTEESFLGGEYTTWHGRSLAAIRADGTGDVLVRAESDTLSEQAVIEVE